VVPFSIPMRLPFRSSKVLTRLFGNHQRGVGVVRVGEGDLLAALRVMSMPEITASYF
jgi:hypothetical protein